MYRGYHLLTLTSGAVSISDEEGEITTVESLEVAHATVDGWLAADDGR